MPDIIEKILRELDTEIVRLSTELTRIRAIRERVAAPILPDMLLVTTEAHFVPQEAPEKPQEAPKVGGTGTDVEDASPISSPPEMREQRPITIDVSPELAEKLAQEDIKGAPKVTHLPPAIPKKKNGEPRKRLMNYPDTWLSHDELLVKIRDWVRERGDKIFTAQELAEGVSYKSSSYLMQKAQSLIDQGVIVQVGKKLPRTYKYGGKPAPEPQPMLPVRAGDDEKKEALPVPGTGIRQHLKSTDKDTNALLASVANQITTRTDGSGHIRVICKRTGQATTVYTTPGSPGLDRIRADLRRIGVRV